MDVGGDSGLGDDGRSGDDDAGLGDGGGEGEGQEGDDQNLPDGGAGQGPIRGVRSRSTDEALKTFFDKERYDQWLFTVDLLVQAGGGQGGSTLELGPGGRPVLAHQVRLKAQWLGRPFLPGVHPGGAGAGNPPPDSGLGPPPPLDAPEEPPPAVDKD
jgi:hypothetical protein